MDIGPKEHTFNWFNMIVSKKKKKSQVKSKIVNSRIKSSETYSAVSLNYNLCNVDLSVINVMSFLIEGRYNNQYKAG